MANRQYLVIVALLLSGFCGFVLSFYKYQHSQHSEDKNTPSVLNSVPVTQVFHNPMSFVQQVGNAPDAGKKIFQEFCTNCHGQTPVIAINAPRIGDSKAWQRRRQLGLAILLKMAADGVGAMPARGGCFECSDEQLRKTIKYILHNSQ